MFSLPALIGYLVLAIIAFALYVYFTKGSKVLSADEKAVGTAAKDLTSGNVAGAVSTAKTIED